MLDLSKLSDVGLACAYMDVLPRDATYAAFHMKRCVTKHEIVTNNGKKTRIVYAPNRLLRWLQGQIRVAYLSQVPRHPNAHGFVSGRGCASNATAHIGDLELMVNIDLKDFFPSISAKRIFGLWRTVFGLNDQVAAVFTKLVTFDDHLAQGFLTSPDLANIISWRLDKRLAGFAKTAGLSYTRYADDLTFGSEKWRGDARRLVDAVRKIVVDEGFTVNEKKVAIMRRGRRQKVTGLVVSAGGVNVPRRLRKLIRAACHHWPQQTPERRASIVGYLTWINSVDPEFVTEMRKDIAEAEASADTRTWARAVSHRPFAHDVKSLSSPRGKHVD